MAANTNAQVDRERMRAVKARAAQVAYKIGQGALTRQAVNAIYRRAARRAGDLALVSLTGDALDDAIAALSTHSLRVGLTQDLFAVGEDVGAIAQALRWSSTGTALRYGRKLAARSSAAARLLRNVRE
jgi:predicted ATP-dependent protease